MMCQIGSTMENTIAENYRIYHQSSIKQSSVSDTMVHRLVHYKDPDLYDLIDLGNFVLEKF